MRESDERLRDRRRLAEEKTVAQTDYHSQVTRATNLASVHDAAAAWLLRIDELNRQSKVADERADELAQQVNELERALPSLELAADAARISAEAAQVECLESRRALAACEESSQRRVSSRTAALKGSAPVAPPEPPPTEPVTHEATADDAGSPPTEMANDDDAGSPSTDMADDDSARPPAEMADADAAPPAMDATDADADDDAELSPTEMTGPEAAAGALMRGDRQALLGVALRLAEETGIEAGRLQLLLLELREQLERRALEEYTFAFPAGHPFWSQFPADAARRVAASLGSMGYRFDGADGWADYRSPQIRDLALALSYCGYDPRSLRRPAGQAAIDALWQGTVVRSEEFLLAQAPDLELPQIVAALGQPSGHLEELWDFWGRLRPLLMRTGAATA